MTLAEIKNFLSLFFFNKEAGRMMNENEIKANYLDIYNDIFKIVENLEKVQKPTNDVVVKFFGTPLVAGMTLAEISEFIGKHTHNAYVANSFFGVPATSAAERVNRPRFQAKIRPTDHVFEQNMAYRLRFQAKYKASNKISFNQKKVSIFAKTEILRFFNQFWSQRCGHPPSLLLNFQFWVNKK